MRFSGTEGEDSFHKAIHLEPVKYVYAIIYRFFKSPLLLFLFIAIIYFSPLLYLARFHPMDTGLDRYFMVILSGLYVVFPSTVEVVAYDLRPYVLLAPLFLLSMLSVYLRRPLWEKLVFFNLMFIAREEGLVFGLIVILFAIAGCKDRQSRRSHATGLISSWFIWLVLSLMYFIWTGYSFNAVLNLRVTLFVLAVAAFSLLALLLLWRKAIEEKVSRGFLQLITYVLVFAPLGFQYFKPNLHRFTGNPLDGIKYATLSLVTYPKYNLYFICALLLTFLVWELMRKRRIKQIIIGCLVIATIMFVSVNAIFLRRDITIEKYTASEVIHDLRESTDKYSTFILTDYATHQAFYDYENVYVYNRLPWYLVAGQERYYPDPENISALKKLLKSDIEYIVVSRESTEEIERLLRSSSIEVPQADAGNGTYKIIRLR
ncbi:MAG: DUF2079 domain-containing protein [Bacteroidales bacterium]|nr:DUF2079 domain-containing protein [Candidatus Latescibacterota bacterium]